MKSQEKSPCLVVIEGKDKGKIFQLRHGTMVIGRSKADIVIQDPRISRSHATIEFNANSGKIIFTDLRSLNGTLLNQELSEKGELKDGDKLQLGNTIFDCQIEIVEATIPAQMLPRRKNPKTEVKPSAKNEVTSAGEDFRGSLSPHQLEPKPELNSKNSDNGEFENRKKTKVHFNSIEKMGKNTRIAFVIGLILLIAFLSQISFSPSKPIDPVVEIERIQSLLKAGQQTPAITAAQALAKENPENALVLYFYADLAFNQNKLEDCINALRKAHTLKEAPALLHVRLAKAYNNAGLVSETTEELKHVNELLNSRLQEDREFVTQAAILLNDTKANPEQILRLARLLKTDLAKDSTIGFKLEASVLLDLKMTEKAIEVLEQGLLLDPKDELLLERLSFAKLSNKDLAGALSILQRWIDSNPKATKPLLVMAYLKFNENEYLAALPYLRNVTFILSNSTQDPDYSEALHLTGKIYFQQNQKAEALQAFQKACSLGFQESCNALGALSAKADEKNNAPASIDESAQVPPASAETQGVAKAPEDR